MSLRKSSGSNTAFVRTGLAMLLGFSALVELPSARLAAQDAPRQEFDEEDSFFVPLEDTEAERERRRKAAERAKQEAAERKAEAERKAREAAEQRRRKREERARRRQELEARRAQQKAAQEEKRVDEGEPDREKREPVTPIQEARDEAQEEAARAPEKQADAGKSAPGWDYGGRVRQHFELQSQKPPPITEDDARIFAGWSNVRGQLRYTSESEDQWSFYGAADLDAIFSSYQETEKFQRTWRGTPRNRLLQLEVESYNEDEALLRASMHRLYAERGFGEWEARAGRLAVRWNTTRFYDPLDLVTPAGPFVLYTDDLPGADGVYIFRNNADHGGEGGLELFAAPYRSGNETDYAQLNSRDLNLLLRYDTGLRKDDLSQEGNGFAYALSGGRHFRSWVWGGDLRYTLSGSTFRLAYLGRHEAPLDEYPFYEDVDPRDRLPDRTVHQLVLGFRRKIFGKVDWNLELFLNGAAIAAQDDRGLERSQRYERDVRADRAPPADGTADNGSDGSFFRTQGRVITRNSTIVQTSFGVRFAESVRGELLLLGDPLGRSFFASPRLQFDFPETEFELGAWLYALPSGPDADEAEFADGQPDEQGELRVFARMQWNF